MGVKCERPGRGSVASLAKLQRAVRARFVASPLRAWRFVARERRSTRDSSRPAYQLHSTVFDFALPTALQVCFCCPLSRFFPVDNFFDSYVGELNQRSKRQAEAALAAGADKHVKLSDGEVAAPGASSAMHAALPAVQQQQQQLGSMPLVLDPGMLAAISGGMAVPQMMLPPGAALPAGAGMGGLALPLVPGVGLQSAPMVLPPGMMAQVDALEALGGVPATDSGAAAPQASAPSAGAGARRSSSNGSGGATTHGRSHNSRLKTVKQQEANKLAQQRYRCAEGRRCHRWGRSLQRRPACHAPEELCPQYLESLLWVLRERKKAKFHELEETVEELRAQLATMQVRGRAMPWDGAAGSACVPAKGQLALAAAVRRRGTPLTPLQATQSRNALLESMNSDLQHQLVEKEREVEKLRLVLESEAGPAATTSASEDLEGDGDSGHLNTARSSGSADALVPCSAAAGPCLPAGADLAGQWRAQVEALRAFMQRRGLDRADPLEASPPLEVLQEAAQLVGRTCQLCQAALRNEGPQVLELVRGDASSLGQSGGGGGHWHAALEAMHLSPEQRQQLLLLRSSHLDKMRAIYAERQTLNMQAMALMLPQGGATPEGTISAIGEQGYLSCAKTSAQLGGCLDRIKDNLRREQRAVLDLNCCVVSRILKPLQARGVSLWGGSLVGGSSGLPWSAGFFNKTLLLSQLVLVCRSSTPYQAAHYLLAIHPNHCDALALTNALFQQQRGASSTHAGVPGGFDPALGPPASTGAMAVAS